VFYTHYASRKGVELVANPRAALLFYWDALGRQVRIEGGTVRIIASESMSYARSRPRASQLSALASPQSRTIVSREQLERWVAELAARYEDGAVPVSETWGGFRLIPTAFEFWQHREDRLHDRLRYSRGEDERWVLERLAP
jgi:pyridoxamine 5'-phosphate oxidase